MHTCLWPGSQILFRHKWTKLVIASLLLHCIDRYSCLRYWKEIFSSMFQDLGWNFLALQCHGNVCNSNPKLIWPRLRIFWSSLSEYTPFRRFISAWTEICMNCSVVILFWQHQNFPIVSLKGNLVCFLKMLVFFSHWIFLISIDKL